MRGTKTAPVVTRVRDEFDRLFDRMLATPWLTEPLPQPPVPLSGEFVAEWTPGLDFAERENDFVIRLDIPGVHKENLDITFADQVLTIVGRRDETKEQYAGTALWREREMGKFVRAIRLPVPVEEEKLEAAYQDGVLTVTLPKAAAAVGHKILIK